MVYGKEMAVYAVTFTGIPELPHTEGPGLREAIGRVDEIEAVVNWA
jgi:hypothetical protein